MINQRIRTYSVFDQRKVCKYRICEVIPTICAINGINMDMSEILGSSSSMNEAKRRLPTVSMGLLRKERINTYSQVMKRPKSRQKLQMTQSVVIVPRFLSIRISARRWGLYEQDRRVFGVLEDEKCEVGYLTHLMVVYLILQQMRDFSIKMQVPSFVENISGLRAELNAYNIMQVQDLLYAVTMLNANDSIWTLVYNICKQQGIQTRKDMRIRFLQMMNDQASKLKMINTRYTSIDGTDDPNNITTVSDLQILINKLMEYDVFHKLIQRKTYKCQATLESGCLSTKYVWKNRMFKYLKRGYKGIMKSNTEGGGSCVCLIHNEKLLILLKCKEKSELKDAEMILKQ